MPQVATNPTDIFQALLLLILAGVAMIAGGLAAGALLRRRMPGRAKGTPYECGELPVGSSWVQFDLRFYVAALLFVIFDVEVVLLYPWAVVFRSAGWVGFADLLFFVGVIALGFIFLWRFGYLDWVRSTAGQRGN